MVWDQEWQDVDPGPGKSPRIGSKISQIWKYLLCDIASDFCTDWRTFETIDSVRIPSPFLDTLQGLQPRGEDLAEISGGFINARRSEFSPR